MKKIILFKVSILLSFFVHSSDLEENWQALEQSILRSLYMDTDEEDDQNITPCEIPIVDKIRVFSKDFRNSPEDEQLKNVFLQRYISHMLANEKFFYGSLETLILGPISSYLEVRSSHKWFMNLITEEEVIREIEGKIQIYNIEIYNELLKKNNVAIYERLFEIISDAKGISASLKENIFTAIDKALLKILGRIDYKYLAIRKSFS